MPTKEKLYGVDAIEFRAAIRPAMFGRIGLLEPILAAQFADALYLWMKSVIDITLSETRLHDRNGNVANELNTNMRVIGRYNLFSLRGEFDAYPWLFPHEFGAEIFPKEGQFLAIPIYNALRPDGSPKFRNPSSWRRFGSFVFKTGGRSFLAYKDAGGELRILYVLVESVTIPARLGLTHHAEEMMPLLWAAWTEIFMAVSMDSGIMSIWDA